MFEMFPQAELENYKLQVELLQEKLQRSEENRQQLEHKLDKILQKRSEHDKSMRHKTRQKYQEFLDEQQKRNERNKMLVQMLERIDHQTTALSARSERLKMMKLQYQMYFAKLVQSQTMRCLQQSTTPAAIPVLVPTATTAAAAAATTAVAATTPNTTNQSLVDTSLSITPRNLSVEPTSMAAGGQQWTLAMATPTQAGMLLAPATRPTTGNEFLPYPVGYMPRINTTDGALDYNDLYVGSGVGLARNFYDVRPSLRAFDIQQQQQQHQQRVDSPARNVDLRKSMYDDGMDNFDDALPTGVYQTTTTSSSREKSPHATSNAGTGELSSTSSTLATSSLTFDKLPKTRLSESAAMEPQQRQHGEQQQYQAATSKNDDIGKPQMEALTGRPRSSGGVSGNGNSNNKFYDGDNDTGINDDDERDNALPNSRVTKVEQEKSSSFAVNNQRAQEPRTSGIEQQQNIAANFAALKIDEPWQATKTWQQTTNDELNMNMNKLERKDAVATFEPHDENTAARMTYTTAAATATAAAVAAAAATAMTPTTAIASADEQHSIMQGNQLPTSLSTLSPATSSLNRANDAVTKPTMSIENIENAIYGELVNPTTPGETGASPLPPKIESGHVTQGLFENLAKTQEPQISEPQAGVTDIAEPTTSNAGSNAASNAHELDANNAAAPTAAAVAADYATDYEMTGYNDEQSASSVSYEPTYATIDGNTAVTNAAITQEQNGEPIYSEISNPTDYQRGYESLSADASGIGAAATINSDSNVGSDAVGGTVDGDNQQDYANIDYSNYDASQYGNAYDPNAYPGYIYDETTGQYIADPNVAQYATDENYGAQGYADGETGNYDYSAAYAQQAQEQTDMAGMETGADLYGESEVTAPSTVPSVETDVPNTVAETTNDLAAENMAAPAAATVEATTPAGGKIVKPTSILSSADKQAAANDAQQKKKKRVNFVDSSETDESSSAKPILGGGSGSNAAGTSNAAGAGSESDFDFSVSSEAQN